MWASGALAQRAPATEAERAQWAASRAELAELGRRLDFVRQIRSEVEGGGFLVHPLAGGALIAPREAVADHLRANPQLAPDGVERELERIAAASRSAVGNELARVQNELDRKRREHLDRWGEPGPSPAGSTAFSWERFQGSVSGEWEVACPYWSAATGQPASGGTFTLSFVGDGTLTGSYRMDGESFAFAGTVQPDGSVAGERVTPEETVTWSGRFVHTTSGMALADGAGAIRVVQPGQESSACTGRWRLS